MGRSVTASWTRHTIRQAVVLGLDEKALIAASGLSRATLASFEERVSYDAHLAVWTYIDECAGSRCLGLEMAQEERRADTMDIMGYLLRACATAGDALRLLGRYGALLNENARQTARQDGDSLLIEDGPIVGAEWPRAYAEHSLASYVILLRRWTGLAVSPLAATFRHERPADTHGYTAVFGSNLTFNAPALTLRFPSTLADQPIGNAEPGLLAHLEVRAQQLLKQLETTPTRDRVRAHLRSRLEEGPTLQSVAFALSLGCRTLQRRLTEEGVRFADLLDEVRRIEAERVVRDRSLSLDECAAQCGFAQASTFRRAFRRWFGQNPGAFRKAVR